MKTTNYWLVAVMTDGSKVTHHCVAKNIDQVGEYAHYLLDSDSEIDYCVPVAVTMTDTDIEIRRAKK